MSEHGDAAFGIVTALEKEYAAVRAMVDGELDFVTPSHRVYVVGTMPAKGGGTHKVVVGLADQGTAAAAVKASHVLEDFPSVRSVLMVGIAGAVPHPEKADHHVRLGDIVVSGEQGVVAYDFVKEHAKWEEPRHPPRPPSADLLSATRRLMSGGLAGKNPWLEFLPRAKALHLAARPPAESDVLCASEAPNEPVAHPHDAARTPGEPRVFVGPVACANRLLKDPVHRDSLREQFGVRAVEMEGFGIAEATWATERSYLVVRGTCDYCDESKGDAWQAYASIVAAAFTRSVLGEVPSRSPAGSRLSATGGADPLQVPVFRSLLPPVGATSNRIEDTRDRILEAIGRGKRVVKLIGRPGDGKTQVACLVARVERGAYLELPRVKGRSDEEVWSSGLRNLALQLGTSGSADIAELFSNLRDALADGGRGRILVLDNADVDSPRSVRDLIRADSGGACVVVGPGVSDADEVVELPPPTGEEFLEIVKAGSSASEADGALRRIGVSCGNSALVAKCVAWSFRAGIDAGDLDRLEVALASGNHGDVHARIEEVVRRAWVSLTELEQRRVALVAALGLPRVPTLWLPSSLLEGAVLSWRMLSDSGVAERHEGEGAHSVTVHRLVASWLDANVPHSVIELELRLLLRDWARDPALADEMKSNPLRAQAFVSGFKFLHQTPPAGPLNIDDAVLMETFFDCLYRSSDFEEQVKAVVPGGAAASRLPPFVLGQLLDTISTRQAATSSFLGELRTAAVVRLEQLARTSGHLPSGYGEAEQQTVSALHHYAKFLLRRRESTEDDRLRATSLLSEIDAKCGSALFSHEPETVWAIKRAQARLQLARGNSTLAAAARAGLLMELLTEGAPALPTYLVLDLIFVLLGLKGVPDEVLAPAQRLSLLRRGIDLCLRESNIEVQAKFLRDAAKALSGFGSEVAQPFLEAVQAIAERIKQRPEVARSVGADVGHALFKAVERRSDAGGYEGLVEALGHLSASVVMFDAYRFVRIAACLRELGKADLSVRVLEAAVGKPDQDRWRVLELAKALRWAGQPADGMRVLELHDPGISTVGTSLDPDNKKMRERCSMRDEFAKCLAKSGAMKDAVAVLGVNQAQYGAFGLSEFSAQCATWSSVDPNGVGGLLEDELRCKRRIEAAGSRALAVGPNAESLVARIVGLKKTPIVSDRGNSEPASGRGATRTKLSKPALVAILATVGLCILLAWYFLGR